MPLHKIKTNQIIRKRADALIIEMMHRKVSEKLARCCQLKALKKSVSSAGIINAGVRERRMVKPF